METTLTPNQIVSSLEDIAMTLKNAGAHRAATMVQVDTQLQELADGAPNEATYNAVVAVWNCIHGVNHLADEAVQSAIISTDFAKELENILNDVMVENDELTRAVNEGDGDHPLVGSLIEDVYADAYESGEKSGLNGAVGITIVERLSNALRLHPSAPNAIGTFIDVLSGGVTLSDDEIEVFIDWCASVGR